MLHEITQNDVAYFDHFVNLPENVDKTFEFVGGEIIEMPSNPYVSKISQIVSGEIYLYLKQNDIGHLTGEAGGYQIGQERYAPDVAFISKTKQPELALTGYNPLPPDLAVEVLFPSTTAAERALRIKVANYLSVGTTVWVILPESFRVEVYIPGEPVQILGINDIIDASSILPNFRLAIKTILPNALTLESE